MAGQQKSGVPIADLHLDVTAGGMGHKYLRLLGRKSHGLMWHHTLLRWHAAHQLRLLAHGPRGAHLLRGLLLPAGSGGPSQSWP